MPGNTRPFDVLVIGDVNPDLVLTGLEGQPTPGRERRAEDALLTIGGSSAITATVLARLGARVRLAGLVGHDALGTFMRQALAANGVDASGVRVRDDVKSGVTVAVTMGEDRMLLTYPGAVAAFSLADIDPTLLGCARHVHVGAFFLQEALRHDVARLLAEALERGLTTSLDPGDDPESRWDELRPVLPFVDILFPNEHEAIALADSVADSREAASHPQRGPDSAGAAGVAARRLAGYVRRMVVVKLGSRGALAVTRDGQALVSPAYPVRSVDTTGAGDAFDAGFLFQWLRGDSLERCLAFACACGSIATTYPGGTSRFPRLEGVLAFMQQRERR